MGKFRDYIEDKIIQTIHNEGSRFMTAHEIAKKSGLSYLAIRRYLERLHELGIVKKEGDTVGKRGTEENKKE